MYFSSSGRDLMIFLSLCPIFFYHFIFELFLGGRTPGKLLTRIRVINKDGSPPGIIAYFLRWILFPIDLFPFILGLGAVSIAFSKHHQRLGDLAAGTVIIRKIKPPQLDIEKDFIEFTPGYKPLFNQVELLTDGQVRLISQFLYTPFNQRMVAIYLQSLSTKVKDLLNIESSMDDRAFLEAIVRDYNYYAARNW